MTILEREKVQAAYVRACHLGAQTPEEAIEVVAASLCLPAEAVAEVALDQRETEEA